jgi:hypothetical protein
MCVPFSLRQSTICLVCFGKNVVVIYYFIAMRFLNNNSDKKYFIQKIEIKYTKTAENRHYIMLIKVALKLNFTFTYNVRNGQKLKKKINFRHFLIIDFEKLQYAYEI